MVLKVGNFSSQACTDQNSCGIGNCGTDLDFRTSQLAPCIAELRFHPPSAELELNLSRPPCAPGAPPAKYFSSAVRPHLLSGHSRLRFCCYHIPTLISMQQWNHISEHSSRLRFCCHHISTLVSLQQCNHISDHWREEWREGGVMKFGEKSEIGNWRVY